MLLEMKDICKDYVQGKEPVRVLKDVCLQVERGDYLAIMGPSGSGKTTLMNLIGCLDVPTGGSYLLDGVDMGQMRSGKLAQVRNETLGFVFQSFYLLPKLSAVDNVALPLLYAGVPKKERRARAEEALRRMGMGDRLKFRPNQLSGGQCQRVAIARAIVTKPKLLLADEPTGALDSASGSQIMDIFDELNGEGVTIIMITHEQEVAARAKRICYIRDGILTGGMPVCEATAPQIVEQESSSCTEEAVAPLWEEPQMQISEPEIPESLMEESVLTETEIEEPVFPETEMEKSEIPTGSSELRFSDASFAEEKQTELSFVSEELTDAEGFEREIPELHGFEAELPEIEGFVVDFGEEDTAPQDSENLSQLREEGEENV